MLNRMKSKVIGFIVTTALLLGLAGSLGGIANAQTAVAGPGAQGCYSYGASFNHLSGRGYWSVSQVNCNRVFWLEATVKISPPGQTQRVLDDRGSGWLSGSRPSPYVMSGNEFACTHNAGYQIVAIVWFANANGSAFQGGYYTSGAPRALC